jgi:hypothetical protein
MCMLASMCMYMFMCVYMYIYIYIYILFFWTRSCLRLTNNMNMHMHITRVCALSGQTVESGPPPVRMQAAKALEAIVGSSEERDDDADDPDRVHDAAHNSGSSRSTYGGSPANSPGKKPAAQRGRAPYLEGDSNARDRDTAVNQSRHGFALAAHTKGAYTSTKGAYTFCIHAHMHTNTDKSRHGSAVAGM